MAWIKYWYFANNFQQWQDGANIRCSWNLHDTQKYVYTYKTLFTPVAKWATFSLNAASYRLCFGFLNIVFLASKTQCVHSSSKSSQFNEQYWLAQPGYFSCPSALHMLCIQFFLNNIFLQIVRHERQLLLTISWKIIWIFKFSLLCRYKKKNILGVDLKTSKRESAYTKVHT